MDRNNGMQRVVIASVGPAVDHGRFAIKRIVGEQIVVNADVLIDGHDLLFCQLLHRHNSESNWQTLPMQPLGNDRWQAKFRVNRTGIHHYTVRAWVDHYRTWRENLVKRHQAGQNLTVEWLVGARLLNGIAKRAQGDDRKRLTDSASRLENTSCDQDKLDIFADDAVNQAAARWPDPTLVVSYPKELPVVVDRERAGYSAWYEFFPRSTAIEPGRHGTFRDCEAMLPYIADMGFDVVYLPPIHPIGRTFRKGKNNAPTAGPEDAGSPWGIGAAEGGHTAVHPQLGILEDFRRFLTKATDHGLEVALDIAFQCAPDHPYVKAHPEWFRQRPDGSIQYAENPPKKYQDIYPFEFETAAWQALWEELKGVIEFWVRQGVRIFRVDNPHTKPFCFWEWLITEVKKKHPDVLFLAEAFTRPKVMYQLAKLGFTQSYTYFSWRNTRHELTQYVTELTQTAVSEYFRPNFWPNTPDILTEYLQYGGRPAFMIRLVLAATLAANYGIYGPAFELGEHQAREHGSEEYLNSEKYEIRNWNLNDPDSLKEFIARVNRCRRENPALHSDRYLRFHPTQNDQLICYSKTTEDGSNVILVVVNLDPQHTQVGQIELPLEQLGLEANQPAQVHDLLSDARYTWQGAHHYVELNPHVAPAHIFRLRRRVRTERDFEYYL